MDYTPAPWTAHREREVPAEWTIRDQRRGVIATIESMNPDDAALIAAAPDLLASVKELLSCIQPDRDWDEAKRARAAIAKATHS